MVLVPRIDASNSELPTHAGLRFHLAHGACPRIHPRAHELWIHPRREDALDGHVEAADERNRCGLVRHAPSSTCLRLFVLAYIRAIPRAPSPFCIASAPFRVGASTVPTPPYSILSRPNPG